MIPVNFPESNNVLEPPEGVTPEECEVLCTLSATTPEGNPVFITCWKLTEEEMSEVLRTKRVWLCVYAKKHPMVSICGQKPFDKINEKE